MVSAGYVVWYSHPMRIRTIFLLLLLVGLGFGARFYWKHLRGAWTAFRPSNGTQIVQLLNTPVEGRNETNFPLRLPQGVSISVFASGLGQARDLTFDPNGTLLVSVPKSGTVLALPDEDGNGVADQTDTVIANLNKPHGVAFHCSEHGDPCALYVAEENRVVLYDYVLESHRASPVDVLVDLPSGRGHETRSLLFLPDGRFLTSIGSSCNVCEEGDTRRASILISNEDGTGTRTFATGLRNAVFLALRPDTGEVWATEMGRDLLGDDTPPDEINVITDGGDYGWPFCYGQTVRDTTFRGSEDHGCGVPAKVDLQAHSAPLGLAFIPDTWPEEYRGDLLVSFHGSWNRTVPTGYKVVRIRLAQDGTVEGTEDFITGWLQGGDDALGRPVDLLFAPDGTLYLSDDRAGVIYRITPPV